MTIRIFLLVAMQNWLQSLVVFFWKWFVDCIDSVDIIFQFIIRFEFYITNCVDNCSYTNSTSYACHSSILLILTEALSSKPF